MTACSAVSVAEVTATLRWMLTGTSRLPPNKGSSLKHSLKASSRGDVRYLLVPRLMPPKNFGVKALSTILRNSSEQRFTSQFLIPRPRAKIPPVLNNDQPRTPACAGKDHFDELTDLVPTMRSKNSCTGMRPPSSS
jgi:hypothetical protein